MVLSYGEKVLGALLLVRAGYYQNQAMACYAESEQLVYYLVSNWRPQDEGDLGERL